MPSGYIRVKTVTSLDIIKILNQQSAFCMAFCILKAITYLNLDVIMVDEATKRTLAQIPLLKTKAGPRDGELWVTRLKEEYQSLIKVHLIYH